MSDLANDPTVVRLLEFAKNKGSVTFDEVKDFLPENLVNTEKLDEIYAVLSKQGIQIEEEDPRSQQHEDDGRCRPHSTRERASRLLG